MLTTATFEKQQEDLMSNVHAPVEPKKEGKASVKSGPSGSAVSYFDQPQINSTTATAAPRIGSFEETAVDGVPSPTLKRFPDTASDHQEHFKRLRELEPKPMDPPVNVGGLLGFGFSPETSVDYVSLQHLRAAMLPGYQNFSIAPLQTQAQDPNKLQQQGNAASGPASMPNMLSIQGRMDEQAVHQGNFATQASITTQRLREELAWNQSLLQSQLNSLMMLPQQPVLPLGIQQFGIQQLSPQSFQPLSSQPQQFNQAAISNCSQQFTATVQQISHLGQPPATTANLIGTPYVLPPQQNATLSSLMCNQNSVSPQGQSEHMPLLRHMNSSSSQFTSLPITSSLAAVDMSSPIAGKDLKLHNNQIAPPPVIQLPLCQEGNPPSSRPFFPLGIDEDPNWLSEFHCFVRTELMEVIRASHDDVKGRNNSITYQQVGIRCRFCAHLPPGARSGRSSAFPSSLRQIYQSFTMMLRDHFVNCDSIPAHILEKFMQLKDKPSQGATDSKRYWMYSAMKIGMTDTTDGIVVSEATYAAGKRSPPFGTNSNKKWEDDAFSDVMLCLPSDRPLISEFLFVLMSQVQPIRLTESECIGNRRSLRVGLPGFGCRYCCQNRRLGLCRMFPARRRTLPSKVGDLYDHLRRCSLCPQSVKAHLERFKQQPNAAFSADQGGDREFFDLVWSRIGHESQSI